MFLRRVLSTLSTFLVVAKAVNEGGESPAPVVASGNFTAVALKGLLQGSTLEYLVVEGDELAGGQDTVTVVYMVPAEAWVAIGFNNNGGFMPGSEAVIGLPDEGVVQKYDLNERTTGGVLPMPEEQQTLINTSIEQADGTTILRFTKILKEKGEIPIIIGNNTFLGAYGFSNALSIHQARGPFSLNLESGGSDLVVAKAANEGGESPAPVVAPGEFTAVALEGRLQGSTLEYLVVEGDELAGGQDTVTVVFVVPAEAWAAIGFNNNGGFMPGSEAVVGLPDEGVVQKYDLNERTTGGVLPMPEEQQTLINTSIEQADGTTILRFTKILEEKGEIPIIIGDNTFLGAYGFSNALSIHQARDSFSLNLESGGSASLDTRKQTFWKAHGWFAALAWGLLAPLAIGAAICRKLFPGGLWFMIHQTLNSLVVVFTIIAFSLAVAAINQETPSGSDANHFSPDPYPHRTTGLVVFLVALLQVLGGVLRPHVPKNNEEKTMKRQVFEIGHRLLGLSLLGLSWYQVQSGIKIYQSIFSESTANLLAIFGGVVAGIVGLVVLGLIKIKMSTGSDEQMLEERAESVDKGPVQEGV